MPGICFVFFALQDVLCDVHFINKATAQTFAISGEMELKNSELILII